MTRDEIAEVLAPLLAGHSPDLQELALAGATRLGEMLHPADLLIYDNYNAVAIGWTFTGKTGDCCVCLPTGTKQVLLGFNWGVKLDDPENRLLGEGKQFRSLKFTSLEMLEDPYVLRLIEDAAALAKRGECSSKVVMKSTSPVRRRPGGTIRD